MTFLFVALFLTVFYDARLLKSRLPDGYDAVMQFSPFRWAVYATVVCLAMLPIYLLRRRRLCERGIDFDDRQMRLADAFEMLLTWFCGVMIVVVGVKLIGFWRPGFRGSLLAVLLVSGFSSLYLVWLMLASARRPGRPAFSSTTALHKPHISPWKAYAGAIAIGILFAVVSSYILQSRAENPSTPLNEALEGNESPVAMALFLLLGLGIAPFLEEIIFRGYLFGLLKTFRGRAVAIIFVAGLFALMHVGQYWGDWLAIVMVTLLGLEITLLRAWSGSIIPGIATHYSYNILVSILPFVFLGLSNPAYVRYVTEYPKLSVEAKEELLLKSIEARPDFAESYNDLAWLYAEERLHLPEALRLSEQALSRQPENSAFLDTKAEVLYRLGKHDEAVEIARAILKRYPHSTYYRNQLKKFSGEAVTPDEKGFNPHRQAVP